MTPEAGSIFKTMRRPPSKAWRRGDAMIPAFAGPLIAGRGMHKSPSANAGTLAAHSALWRMLRDLGAAYLRNKAANHHVFKDE
jgi:hypothetical protein